MRTINLLLLLSLSLITFSCIEESSSLTSPGLSNPDTPSFESRTVVDASSLATSEFSMAVITLEGEAGVPINEFRMPSCYLTVLRANCTDPATCFSKLDEDNSSLNFNNTYFSKPGNNHQLISFSPIEGEEGIGVYAAFLNYSVLPLLTEAEWTVEQQGEDFYLSCQECPLQYDNTRYQKREIKLTR
ncbi:MAG: hypothetical protein AAFU67_19320 [Bacteroidota bacterium]